MQRLAEVTGHSYLELVTADAAIGRARFDYRGCGVLQKKEFLAVRYSLLTLLELMRPVASGTEADERMTGGELIYIRNRKAQK